MICLHVELYNDNLKIFNQAWEETFPAFGNDLDERVLENCCERQVTNSTLMKPAMTIYQPDLILKKKKPRSYQETELPDGNDAVLQTSILRHRNLTEMFTDSSKEFIKACQDSQARLIDQKRTEWQKEPSVE